MGVTLKSPFIQRANFELAGVQRTHKGLLRDYTEGKKRFKANEITMLIRTKYYTCQLFNNDEEFAKFLDEYVAPYLKQHNLKIFIHDRFKKVVHAYGKPSYEKIDEWGIGVTLKS